MKSTLELQDSKQAHQIDSRRRHFILAFVSYITTTVMFIYGIKNLDGGSPLLTTILFGTGSAFLLNILVYKRSRQLTRACIIEALLVGTFVLSLVYQGGNNNTALYWVFPFPAILFGLLGVRHALLANSLLMLLLSVMLFMPDIILAHYKDAESSRFIASLSIVIVACWINEHFRERSHEAMNRLQQQKSIQANTDPLTGLANRRFIDSVLVPNIQSKPEQYLPTSLVLCDIDHFKRLNDSFGHDCGDEVLRAVSQLFSRQLRQSDFACRTGGEEFLLVLTQTEQEDAVQVAQKIRQLIATQSFVDEQPDYSVTASFGVSQVDDLRSFADAVKTADQRLYQAKHGGRNRVVG